MLSRCRNRTISALRTALTAGVAALALSACATSPTTTGSISTPDFSAGSTTQLRGAIEQLGEQYKRNPGDRTTILYYSAALRANGQAEQAIAVLEDGMTRYKSDPQIKLAYAKALVTGGRLDQALNVLDAAIDPRAPDWNALSVKGAILDQQGRNAEARQVYMQALKIAPEQASLHANLGLSYSMTNELDAAEKELRIAASLRGANSKIRQNLALVIGLQGRFDEARKLFAAELPPEGVEANMSYIRTLLTQKNRWELIKADG